MSVAVAQVVPQNVEKIPLYHWRPGARLLVVGARYGATFDGSAGADDGSFKRQLDAALLATAVERSRCDGLAAAWGNSLAEGEGLALLTGQAAPLVMITAGHADPAVIEAWAPRVAAWLLLAGSDPGPAAAAILEQGAHVEVLWAVDDRCQPPDLPWERARAVHVCNTVIADPSDRYDQARAALPAGLAVYDSRHGHSDCACGETLVWRSGGRSRLDALDPQRCACRHCGRLATTFTLG